MLDPRQRGEPVLDTDAAPARRHINVRGRYSFDLHTDDQLRPPREPTEHDTD